MFRIALTAAVMLVVLAVASVQPAEAAKSLDAATMKAALQTATVEEDGFIQHVLNLVDAGRLPESMVVSTFIWARKKPRLRFQYFKTGLTVRARQKGIRL